MLSFTTPLDYNTTATRRALPVHRFSMASGKSCFPRCRGNSVAYANRFNTVGSAEKVTEVHRVRGGFQIRVAKLGVNGEPEICYNSGLIGIQQIVCHIFSDLQTGNHRLYSSEAPARSRNGRDLEFQDGISLLLRGLERLTGESWNSRFIPAARESGCRSNFPTLEKVVFSQGRRHNKVHRPVRSTTSFSSGMATDEKGGAKPPSLKDQVARDMRAAKRNLEWAEKAISEGNVKEAEYRFETACEYESRASETRSVLTERAILLRERVTLARAKKAEKRAAEKADESAA